MKYERTLQTQTATRRELLNFIKTFDSHYGMETAGLAFELANSSTKKMGTIAWMP